MNYVRIADNLNEDIRFVKAGERASWSWVCSVMHCSRQKCFECMVPIQCARIFCDRGRTKRTIDRLVQVGLWKCLSRDYLFVVGLGELFEFGADRQSISPRQRQRIIDRDGLVCGICGGSVDEDDVHIDHVRPVLVGGRTEDSNLRVSHSLCNLRRPKRPESLDA